jgi:hypothetical protein
MVQKIIQERWHAENPAARLGTEGEVSSAVVYLLSPAASYVNGVALKVDGGQSFRQGAIFEKEVFAKESVIPIYTGFELDEEAIKSMAMTPEYEAMFRKYAAIKRKGAKL